MPSLPAFGSGTEAKRVSVSSRPATKDSYPVSKEKEKKKKLFLRLLV